MLSNIDKNSPSFQLINQRYLQSLQYILRKKNFPFNLHIDQHKNQFDSQLQQHVILEVKQSQQIKSQQDKFYFDLMRKFYDQRKIINPELTFQVFLTDYNQKLTQKLKKFQIYDKLQNQTLQNPSTKLNRLILQNELKILTSLTIELIQSKKSQINQLQSESQKINQQYHELIENLVQKPTELNVENLQLQVKLKLKEQKRKDSLMKNYTNISTGNKVSFSKRQSNSSKVQNDKSEIKQQIERIKTVTKNNMWGYGQQINQRLEKLKFLKGELKII